MYECYSFSKINFSHFIKNHSIFKFLIIIFYKLFMLIKKSLILPKFSFISKFTSRCYGFKLESKSFEQDDNSPKPLELKVQKLERVWIIKPPNFFNKKALCIKWEDGSQTRLPAEYLRVERLSLIKFLKSYFISSPSAEVQSHNGQKRLIFGRKYVGIMEVIPQGHYGVLIKFDDLHESGIYTWNYLYYLGKNKIRLMKQYIKELRTNGKSRDPRENNNQNKLK